MNQPAQFLEQTNMWSKTIDGIEMDLSDLDPALITVKRIAGPLARINRWGGHYVVPISVARHCIMLVDRLRRLGIDDPVILLQALFHDAVEAYTQDIPTPLKDRLTIKIGDGLPCRYREFEDYLLGRIFKVLGIPTPVDQLVWTHDSDIHKDELRIVTGNTKRVGFSLSPEVTEAVFCSLADELFRQLMCKEPL